MQKRLENLKNSKNLGWGELAEVLGISRSMLDQVRKGEKVFGPKTMRKLLEVEVAAGLRPQPEENKDPVAMLSAKLDEILRRLDAIEAHLRRH